MENIDESWLDKIEAFAAEDEHVKDILLASLLEFGLVHPDLMNTLLDEYREVRPEFLEELKSEYKE